MGLISRVSSRTYRMPQLSSDELDKLIPKYEKKKYEQEKSHISRARYLEAERNKKLEERYNNPYTPQVEKDHIYKILNPEPPKAFNLENFESFQNKDFSHNEDKGTSGGSSYKNVFQ